MKKLFKVSAQNIEQGRIVGVSLRLLGVDFSLLGLGWLSDWVIIDVRCPCNKGVYVQALGLIVSIGVADDKLYED